MCMCMCEAAYGYMHSPRRSPGGVFLMLVKEQCSDGERKDIFLKDKLIADTRKKIARQRKKEERRKSLKESSFNDTTLLYYICLHKSTAKDHLSIICRTLLISADNLFRGGGESAGPSHYFRVELLLAWVAPYQQEPSKETGQTSPSQKWGGP